MGRFSPRVVCGHIRPTRDRPHPVRVACREAGKRRHNPIWRNDANEMVSIISDKNVVRCVDSDILRGVEGRGRAHKRRDAARYRDDPAATVRGHVESAQRTRLHL